MKKYIIPLIAAAFMAATPLTQAVTPKTNIVQTISISLEFVSQIYYTNADFGVSFGLPFTNWDVLRTNKTARTTNVVDTYSIIERTVTNIFVTKDVVKAINPDLAGGSLVLVTFATDTNNGNNSEVQIRKGTTIYSVPEGTLTLSNPSFSVSAAKFVVVTNTLYKGTNAPVITLTTNSSGGSLSIRTLSLTTTNSLSFNVSGAVSETGQTVIVAGAKHGIRNTSSTTLVGTGSDARGNNEIVLGRVVVNGARVEN